MVETVKVDSRVRYKIRAADTPRPLVNGEQLSALYTKSLQGEALLLTTYL